VILFDENCQSSATKSEIFCSPSIEDSFLLFAIVTLLFSFIVSKTMFASKNFYLFHKAPSAVPIVVNFVTLIVMVALVWFTVRGDEYLLVPLTVTYVVLAAAFAITSAPSLKETVDSEALLWVGLIAIVNMGVLAAVIWTVATGFEAEQTFTTPLLLLISFYILAQTMLNNMLCYQVHGL
tara:strand:- start:7496 stop:8035 length:540 start_codon:yes stop_codon:yes gene_type:complete